MKRVILQKQYLLDLDYGNYLINDSLDDHDFDQIPDKILDKESGEIDIEKFQDIYGSDYELKPKEDYLSKFIDSFSIKIDEENVNVNLNILYKYKQDAFEQNNILLY